MTTGRTNLAVTHFTTANGAKEPKDLREFSGWYGFETLQYLAHLHEKKSPLLRMILWEKKEHDFNKQLSRLTQLSNAANMPAFFITFEPARISTSHFIMGVVWEQSLLIINPLGETVHNDFYEEMVKLKNHTRFPLKNIYLSTTKIQREGKGQLYENGLVSCGPICAELMAYLTSTPIKTIFQNLAAKKSKIKSGLEYYAVEIDTLLPASLTALITSKDLTSYQTHAKAIRAKHLEWLEHPFSNQPHLSITEQNNLFLNYGLDRNEIDLFNDLLSKGLDTDALKKDARYQQLVAQKPITTAAAAATTSSPTESKEARPDFFKDFCARLQKIIDEGKNTDALNKCIQELIENPTLLNQTDENGLSPLQILSKNVWSNNHSFFSQNMTLRAAITSQGLNAVPHEGKSALYMFARKLTVDGGKNSYIIQDETILNKISPNALNAIATFKDHEATSPLLLFAASAIGRQLLLKNKHLRQCIRPSAFNTASKSSWNSGKTPYDLLNTDETGQAVIKLLMEENEEIRADLTSKAAKQTPAAQSAPTATTTVAPTTAPSPTESKKVTPQVLAAGYNRLTKIVTAKTDIEALKAMISELIANPVLLNQANEDGESLLWILAIEPWSRRLINEDPALRAAITSEGLNRITKRGKTSTLYWLAIDLIFLKTEKKEYKIAIQDERILNLVSQAGLNSPLLDTNEGKSVLLYFVGTDAGRQLLMENANLRRNILPDGLNTVSKADKQILYQFLILNGAIGQNILNLLTQENEKIRIYVERKNLINKVNVIWNQLVLIQKSNDLAALNKIIQELIANPDLLNQADDEGDSNLLLLTISPWSRIIISQNSKLRAAITAEGLNTISQKRGISPLFWLAMDLINLEVKDGEYKVAIQDERILNLASPDGLNATSVNPYEGSSVLLLFTGTDVGRQLLMKFKNLRQHILLHTFNTVSKNYGKSPYEYLIGGGKICQDILDLLMQEHEGIRKFLIKEKARAICNRLRPILQKETDLDALNKIIQELIAHPELLNQADETGISPLFLLTTGPWPRNAMSQNPALIAAITSEGLNTVLQIGTSPLYWLTIELERRSSSNGLIIQSENILKQVSQLSLNSISKSDNPETSPLFYLTVSPAGHELLMRSSNLRRNILPSALHTVPKSTKPGISPYQLLAQSPSGQAVLHLVIQENQEVRTDLIARGVAETTQSNAIIKDSDLLISHGKLHNSFLLLGYGVDTKHCDLLLLSSPPTQENISNLSIKSSYAYAFTNDAFYYIDKINKVVTKITDGFFLLEKIKKTLQIPNMYLAKNETSNLLKSPLSLQEVYFIYLITGHVGEHNEGGVCHGFSHAWVLAFFAKKEYQLFNRLRLINMTENLDTQIQLIYEKLKRNSKIIPTQQENSLLEIPAFFEPIALFQSSAHYQDFLGASYQQEDCLAAAPFVLPEELKKRGGIARVYLDIGLLSTQELQIHLESIKIIIKEKNLEETALVLASSEAKHTIGLRYNLRTARWLLVDTNRLPKRPEDWEVDDKDIAERIASNFNWGGKIFFDFTITIYAIADQAEKIKSLLQQIPQLRVTPEIANRVTSSGFSLTHIAAKEGKENTVEEIKTIAPNMLHTPARFGFYPLHIAAMKGNTGIIRILAKTGINIDTEATDGNTATHQAAVSGADQSILVLHTLGASLNKENKKGFPPAVFAVRFGYLNVLKRLKQAGANLDIRIKSEDGRTLAHYAAESNKMDILEFLNEFQINLNEQTTITRFMPADYAASDGYASLINLLGLFGKKTRGDERINFSNKTTHVAATYGKANVIQALAKFNFNFNQKLNGKTPAHLAVDNNHPNVIDALREAKADVDIPDDQMKRTPAHYAAEKGDTSLILALHNAGVNWNRPDKDGMTPLALANQKKHHEAIELLRELGAGAEMKHEKALSPR